LLKVLTQKSPGDFSFPEIKLRKEIIVEKHNPKERQIIYCDTGIYRTTWCGPFAVATVAGIDYEPAYQTLKKIRGKRHCKGVSNSNIKVACKRLGIQGEWHKLEKRRIFRKFWKENLEPGKVYIVQVTKHVLVVDTRDWTTIDNQNPEWVAMDASHHWNKKLVHNFFEVKNPKFESKCDDQFSFDFDLVA
jgi:hypothetical protein